jgi:hypothetical protein
MEMECISANLALPHDRFCSDASEKRTIFPSLFFSLLQRKSLSSRSELMICSGTVVVVVHIMGFPQKIQFVLSALYMY